MTMTPLWRNEDLKRQLNLSASSVVGLVKSGKWGKAKEGHRVRKCSENLASPLCSDSSQHPWSRERAPLPWRSYDLLQSGRAGEDQRDFIASTISSNSQTPNPKMPYLGGECPELHQRATHLPWPHPTTSLFDGSLQSGSLSLAT